MQMTMFNIGDRVLCSYFKNGGIPFEGIIVCKPMWTVDEPGFREWGIRVTDEDNFNENLDDITFGTDTHNLNGFLDDDEGWWVSENEMQLIYQVQPYNPEQQGDKDDDL
jgi:hypothetical protein